MFSIFTKDAKEFYSILKHVFIRLSMFISIFNLLALTFDRYLAITTPLEHRKRGRSFTYKVILGVWFFSVGCVTLIYCISRYKLSNVEKYNNMVFPISSYTTFAVFLFCYTLIYRAVRNSNNMGRNKAIDNFNMKKEVRTMYLLALTLYYFYLFKDLLKIVIHEFGLILVIVFDIHLRG